MSSSWDVFISYSSRDAQTAERLASDLEANGYRPFFAERSIRAGAPWPPVIQKALEESRVGVVILDKDAVASDRVQEEVTALLDRKVLVIPILDGISPQDIDFRLRHRQLLDLRDGYDHVLRELLSALPPPRPVAGPEPPAGRPEPARRSLSLRTVLAALVGVVLSLVTARIGWVLVDQGRGLEALRHRQRSVQRIEERLNEVLEPGAGARVRGHKTYVDPETRELLAKDVWQDERLRWRHFYDQGRPVARDEFEYVGERRERVKQKTRSYLDAEGRVFLEDLFTPDGYLIEKLECPEGSPPCVRRIDDMASPLPPQGLLIYYR